MEDAERGGGASLSKNPTGVLRFTHSGCAALLSQQSSKTGQKIQKQSNVSWYVEEDGGITCTCQTKTDRLVRP